MRRMARYPTHFLSSMHADTHSRTQAFYLKIGAVIDTHPGRWKTYWKFNRHVLFFCLFVWFPLAVSPRFPSKTFWWMEYTRLGLCIAWKTRWNQAENRDGFFFLLSFACVFMCRIGFSLKFDAREPWKDKAKIKKFQIAPRVGRPRTCL